MDAWSAVFKESGVDTLVRWDWCSLYVASDQERNLEALPIIHKILRKDSGGHPVDNPSGCVVVAVRNAWRSLRDIPEDDNREKKGRWS